jgi:hypothetical protein
LCSDLHDGPYAIARKMKLPPEALMAAGAVLVISNPVADVST